MEYKKKLSIEQIKILKDIENPTITEIIELSQTFKVDIHFLIEYFISKENENKYI